MGHSTLQNSLKRLGNIILWYTYRQRTNERYYHLRGFYCQSQPTNSLKAPKSKVTVNSALNSACYPTNSYPNLSLTAYTEHSGGAVCARTGCLYVQPIRSRRRDFFHCTYSFNLVTRRGRARTQAPTTRNCTVVLLTLVAIAEVSPSEVQCKGLTLEETPL